MSEPSIEAGRQRRSSGNMLKLALGLFISAVFLYGTLRAIPFANVLAVLGSAAPEWIAAALGFIALAYVIKIYRWVVMLRSLGSAVSFREASVPFLGGIAFNNVLPFRAGDVIRVLAFKRFTGVAASGQIGSLILERLLDLLVLMSFLFATASYLRAGSVDETLLGAARIAALGVAAVVVIFIAAPGLIRFTVRAAEARLPKLRKPGEAFLRLSEAVATLSRPLFIARVTLLSVLGWMAEGGAFFAVGHAIGIASTAPSALLTVSIGTLSTIIPSSPGYVGTFHYFTARAIEGLGATAIQGAAYAILIHALLWLSITIVGFALLLISGASRRGQGRECGS